MCTKDWFVIVTARKLRDENSMLKRRDLKPVEVRDAVAATSTQILQGITRAALQTSSFMSAQRLPRHHRGQLRELQTGFKVMSYNMFMTLLKRMN